MPTFADRLLHFLRTFHLPAELPAGVEALSPFREPAVYNLLRQFAHRFYAGNWLRVAMPDINPGRLSMGRTGVAFTDPGALAELYGIAHSLPRQRPGISAQSVYWVVAALGGATAFYQHFYLGSVYPLWYCCAKV